MDDSETAKAEDQRMPRTDACQRCGKLAPTDDDTSVEALEWDPPEDGGLVCPGCLTAEEVQTMDEDVMAMETCSGCGQPVPTTRPEDEGWVFLLATRGWLCPSCVATETAHLLNS